MCTPPAGGPKLSQPACCSTAAAADAAEAGALEPMRLRRLSPHIWVPPGSSPPVGCCCRCSSGSMRTSRLPVLDALTTAPPATASDSKKCKPQGARARRHVGRALMQRVRAPDATSGPGQRHRPQTLSGCLQQLCCWRRPPQPGAPSAGSRHGGGTATGAHLAARCRSRCLEDPASRRCSAQHNLRVWHISR